MSILTKPIESINSGQKFIEGFLRDPRAFATIFPTFESSAAKMVEMANFRPGQKILELGSGSGAISEVIIKNLPRDSQYLGLEQDGPLVSHLNNKFPGDYFRQGDARFIERHSEGRKFNKVIASLPWTVMGEDEREDILDSLKRNLSPSGRFIFFICAHVQFSSSARRFLDSVAQHGFKIDKRVLHVFNVPPIYIYRAKFI